MINRFRDVGSDIEIVWRATIVKRVESEESKFLPEV